MAPTFASTYKLSSGGEMAVAIRHGIRRIWHDLTTRLPNCPTSRQHLYGILRERKPVSPAVAVRLGKLFGGAGV
jgi:hypothetical protein